MNSEMNALDTHIRADLRHMQAQAFTSCLMAELKHIIPYDLHEPVFRCLAESLYLNGGSWTTDRERERMGLEPRDELGWTCSERVKLEQERSNAMFLMSEQIIAKHNKEKGLESED